MSIIDLVLALEPNESITFKKLDFHIEISVRVGLSDMHFFVSIEEMQLNAIPRHIAQIILNNLKVLRQCKKGTIMTPVIKDAIRTVRCISCKTLHGVAVNTKDFLKWENGMLIQDAMPYLSPDKRELLISNLCPTCFDKITSDEDLEKLMDKDCIGLSDND